MKLFKQTSTGIDIDRVLKAAEAEIRTEQLLSVDYDDEGKLKRTNGIPVMVCYIQNTRTKAPICHAKGSSDGESLDKAIAMLIEKTGVEATVISAEARLKLEVATLKQQMADLMVSLAMPASPAPTRRKKVDFDVTNSAE